MALTLRSTKGSALTHAEMDDNFSGLANGTLITQTPVTWTPTLTFATPGDLSVAYTTRLGEVTKTGNSVRATFSIVTSAFTHTTASGALQITGLPYAVASDSIACDGALLWGGVTKANYTSMDCAIAVGSSTITFGISGSGQAPAAVSVGDVPTGGTVTLRGTINFRTSS